jgi:hypothetical protein
MGVCEEITLSVQLVELCSILSNIVLLLRYSIIITLCVEGSTDSLR